MLCTKYSIAIEAKQLLLKFSSCLTSSKNHITFEPKFLRQGYN